jgi:outer membrane lipoprotein SlyB
MINDQFKKLRSEILEENRQSLASTPASLTENNAKTGGIAGAISGVVSGAYFGSSIGIATGGIGIAATIPLAIIGGVIGYFGGEKIGASIEKNNEPTETIQDILNRNNIAIPKVTKGNIKQ